MKTIAITLCAVLVFGNIAFTNSDDLPPSYTPSIHQIIVKQSQIWHVKEEQIYNVVKAESGFNQNAIGDKGLAKNCAQYHEATFNRYENLYFKKTGEHLEYNSCMDQIKLMSWQWNVYPQSKHEWTTYTKLYGVN